MNAPLVSSLENLTSAPADDDIGQKSPTAETCERTAFLKAMQNEEVFRCAPVGSMRQAQAALAVAREELHQKEFLRSWREIGKAAAAANSCVVRVEGSENLWWEALSALPPEEENNFWGGCVLGGNFLGREHLWGEGKKSAVDIFPRAALSVMGMANPVLASEASVMLQGVVEAVSPTEAYECLWLCREAAWGAQQRGEPALAEALRTQELDLAHKSGLVGWSVARPELKKYTMEKESAPVLAAAIPSRLRKRLGECKKIVAASLGWGTKPAPLGLGELA